MKKLYLALTLMLTAAAAVSAAPFHKHHAMRKAAVATPEVLPATNITAEGFTANWKAVPGADGYCLFVQSREEVTNPGRKVVLYEDFCLVSQGSVIEPVYLEEYTSQLDEYGLTLTPDWIVSQAILAGGKISGVIWTPTLDLRADNGKYRVVMTIQGYAGQEVMVVSNGTAVDTRKEILKDNGNNEIVLDFTNGDRETYLRIVDNGFPDDTEGLYIDKIAYLDDIEFSQEFSVGDDVWRPVALVDDCEETSHTFTTLPFRGTEKRLYYDLYAASIYYPNYQEDPYDYEVSYSDFSPKQEVLLEGYDAGVNDLESADFTADFTADYGAIRYNGSERFEIFDLAGREVAAGRGATTVKLSKGLYIVRASGSAGKMIVK